MSGQGRKFDDVVHGVLHLIRSSTGSINREQTLKNGGRIAYW